MKLSRILIALAMAGAMSTAAVAQKATSADLVSQLTKELGSTTQQAEGAAGSIFSLAQSRMKPDDWSKVSASVPGMDSLLKAAPAAPASPVGTTGITGASSLTGLASVTSAFSKLGLKPEMVQKAIPIITSFVTKNGGGDVGKLLASVLK
jgi:hypothetical protein